MVRKFVLRSVDLGCLVLGLPIILVGMLLSAAFGRKPPKKPRILWGSQPIKALMHMARSAELAGYTCDVAVRSLSPIYSDSEWDHVVVVRTRSKELNRALNHLAAYIFFARALRRYEIFAFYFDGGMLQSTLLQDFEIKILKMLGKKVVLIPYGSDTWLWDHIPNLLWRAALLIDNPDAGRSSKLLERRIRNGSRLADCVLGCLVHISCLPRWDILPLTCYPVDTDALKPTYPSAAGPLRVAHAANHRGFKGTDFLIEVVRQLRAEGYEIELDVIERVTNDQVLARIAKADVYVDQLVAGYAFAALEAMALGKVVISATGETEAAQVFRRYSYLNEAPIIPASVESIYDVLRNLTERREELVELGQQSREFCERRHSIPASSDMWDSIFRRIWFNEEIDLINYYHPLIGTKPRHVDATIHYEPAV